MNFEGTDETSIRDSSDTVQKVGVNGAVQQLFIYFKKLHDSARREVQHDVIPHSR